MLFSSSRLLSLLALVGAMLPLPSLQGRDTTTILDDLPPHMRVLVDWGQRPEWSIDGKWIYFLPRAYADIFRIEVASGKIEPVTSHYFHEGYKRVLCLWNGDLLLAGPDEFDASDPWASRHKLRLSILKAPFDRPAVLLDAYCDEGPAVSKTDNRIAWTLPGQREIMMAEVGTENGQPALLNRRMVLSFDEQNRPLTERLETQDFVPGRNQLVFTYYHGTIEEPFYYANAYTIDLGTGELVNLTQNENRYDEAEGIAPDGSFLLVESDRHAEPKRWKVDVYLLKLDGTNQPERLADWTKYPGFRSDNPVVSPDGKTIAIQRGFRAGAGQGSGIVLFDLESYRRNKP
jgi:hypothetical protein